VNREREVKLCPGAGHYVCKLQGKQRFDWKVIIPSFKLRDVAWPPHLSQAISYTGITLKK